MATDLIARLMVQCVRYPDLADVLSELVSFFGNECYICDGINSEELCGKRFGDLQQFYPEAIPIGVQSLALKRIVLNPPADYVIESGDHLVLVAEDENQLAPVMDTPARPQPSPWSIRSIRNKTDSSARPKGGTCTPCRTTFQEDVNDKVLASQMSMQHRKSLTAWQKSIRRHHSISRGLGSSRDINRRDGVTPSKSVREGDGCESTSSSSGRHWGEGENEPPRRRRATHRALRRHSLEKFEIEEDKYEEEHEAEDEEESDAEPRKRITPNSRVNGLPGLERSSGLGRGGGMGSENNANPNRIVFESCASTASRASAAISEIHRRAQATGAGLSSLPSGERSLLRSTAVVCRTVEDPVAQINDLWFHNKKKKSGEISTRPSFSRAVTLDTRPSAAQSANSEACTPLADVQQSVARQGSKGIPLGRALKNSPFRSFRHVERSGATSLLNRCLSDVKPSFPHSEVFATRSFRNQKLEVLPPPAWRPGYATCTANPFHFAPICPLRSSLVSFAGHFLLCGWRRGMVGVIKVLDDFITAPSELWLYSEVPLASRKHLLEQAGLHLDSKGRSQCLKRLTIVFHKSTLEGSLLNKGQMKKLPLEKFKAIMVMADEFCGAGGWSTGITPGPLNLASISGNESKRDSSCLSTVFLLRMVQLEKLQGVQVTNTSNVLHQDFARPPPLSESGDSGDCTADHCIADMLELKEKCGVVAELLDPKTVSLLAQSWPGELVLVQALFSLFMFLAGSELPGELVLVQALFSLLMFLAGSELAGPA
eukprot:gene14480-20504_t